jgi:hypothetical protein
MIVDPCYFILNHYSCQSLDFWQHTKRVRGDGDGYKPRDMGCFRILDRNDLEDLQLYDQNKDII